MVETEGVDYVLGWRRIAVSTKPLPRSWQKPSASMRAPAGRRGCSGISVTKTWRVGLPRGVWWARPNTWPKGRILVLSSPHSPGRSRTPEASTNLYCARGEMENRIKEQQLALFANRTSTQALRSNQLRLYISSFTYVLIETLRASGLGGSELAQAQCDTIRLKLLNRRPDPHHGAQSLNSFLRSLSLCEPLPSGAGPSAADPLALLVTAIGLFHLWCQGSEGGRGSLGLRSQNASNHLHLSTETSINYSICLVGISTAASIQAVFFSDDPHQCL